VRSQQSLRTLLTAGVALLAAVAILAIGVGSVAIPPTEVIGILMQGIGVGTGAAADAGSTAIVVELRLPRIAAAILVGGALAVAGGVFQSLLRNPLADPYVLGTSSGAALGAAVAILLPISGVAWELGGVQLAAFAGALAAVGIVWRVAGIGSGEERIASVLLVGYAVASLLAAALSLVMLMSGANLRAIFGFLLGGLDGVTWPRLLAAALPIAAATALLALRGRPLAAFLLGDEAATHLGVDVRRERRIAATPSLGGISGGECGGGLLYRAAATVRPGVDEASGARPDLHQSQRHAERAGEQPCRPLQPLGPAGQHEARVGIERSAG